MKSSERMAIVGSGASGLYLLKHVLRHVERLHKFVRTICVFEQGTLAGVGMPYHPKTTDPYNLANTSSKEIPRLAQSFASWLKQQNTQQLQA